MVWPHADDKPLSERIMSKFRVPYMCQRSWLGSLLLKIRARQNCIWWYCENGLGAIIKIYGDIVNWRIYMSPALNEWSVELGRASRYINYNKLLQQWQWPIIHNKTCICRVKKLACLFGKNDYEEHSMNLSISRHEYWQWHNLNRS